MPYVYFKYSAQQEEFFKRVEESMGRRYKVGVVFTKGTKKSFTEMSSTPTSRYSDTKIVAQGEQSDFKYTIPGGAK